MAPVPGRDITKSLNRFHGLPLFQLSSSAVAGSVPAAPPQVHSRILIPSKGGPGPFRGLLVQWGPSRAPGQGDQNWRPKTCQLQQLLPAFCSLTLSSPNRTSSRTWTSAAPSLGVLPAAPQTGLLSRPQHLLQAAPRLRCLLLSRLLCSQPVFLPRKQAPSCSQLDWPQPLPQRLSPQPSGTMAQLWAIAPCTSWMPSISFLKRRERNEWEMGRVGPGLAEPEAAPEGLGMFFLSTELGIWRWWMGGW